LITGQPDTCSDHAPKSDAQDDDMTDKREVIDALAVEEVEQLLFSLHNIGADWTGSRQ
jgi:hypothetical protein